MSKNKYKYSSLKKKSGILYKEGFSMDNSKIFIMTLLLCFHILPLIFLLCGEAGRQLLMSVGMLVLNPIFIMMILIFYGVRVGFNIKMPLLTAVISGASVGMYYLDSSEPEYLFYLFQTVTVMFAVYLILAMGFCAVGALIKQKLM